MTGPRIIEGETPAAPRLIVEPLGPRRYSLRVYGCLGYEIGGQAYISTLDPDSRSARWAALDLEVTAGIPTRSTLRALRRVYMEEIAAEVAA
jgi:hypothetical protein